MTDAIPILSLQRTHLAQERLATHQGLRPLLFLNSEVGSFTSQKNQISVSAVRRNLLLFFLIQEY